MRPRGESSVLLALRHPVIQKPAAGTPSRLCPQAGPKDGLWSVLQGKRRDLFCVFAATGTPDMAAPVSGGTSLAYAG
jgi:hypothetical protein